MSRDRRGIYAVNAVKQKLKARGEQMKLFDGHTHTEIELPATIKDFRGIDRTVIRIAQDSSPSKSGKIETDDGRIFYPGVVHCYISMEPRG
jgi:hypothetical protein